MIKFLIFLSVMGGLALYVTVRFFARSPWPDISRFWIFVIAAAIVGLQFIAFKGMALAPAAYHETPWLAPLVSIAAWTIYTTIGAFYCAILFTLMTDIGGLAAGWLSPSTSPQIIHRAVFYLDDRPDCFRNVSRRHSGAFLA
jgi:hypothetical protein